MVKATSKVAKSGQTQVPKDIQNHLGLKEGDKILWEVKNGKVNISKWY